MSERARRAYEAYRETGVALLCPWEEIPEAAKAAWRSAIEATLESHDEGSQTGEVVAISVGDAIQAFAEEIRTLAAERSRFRVLLAGALDELKTATSAGAAELRAEIDKELG
jgi:hypothetical protein